MPVITPQSIKYVKYKPPVLPKSIGRVVILTYERPGFLTHTVESVLASLSGVEVVVYDDGSQLVEKLMELEAIESKGVKVVRLEHRGILGAWRQMVRAATIGLAPWDGVVLMEDDVVVAPGWDKAMISMAVGACKQGFRVGAVSCLRCHNEPQSEVRNLDGVMAYQSMGHGFQINLFPCWVLNEAKVIDEAFSKAGKVGFDVWLVSLLAHRLNLSSFVSVDSWAWHIGSTCSTIAKDGMRPFCGVGCDMVPELAQLVAKAERDLHLF